MKKKPRKSKRIGDLDSTVEYKGKTIANQASMTGYGSYDSRNPKPRGKGIKRNRYD